MEVKATFNDHGLIRKYETMPNELDAAIKKATGAVMVEVLRELQGRDGLTKFARHKKGTKTPSPAGEGPPAQVTGMLARNMKRDRPRRVAANRYEASVMPAQPYAIFQELGTDTLPKRPFVGPTRERLMMKGTILKAFQLVLRQELKKYGGE